MKAEIKSGIQEIIQDAGLGKEVNLFYDIKSKCVFAGGEDKQDSAIFIGLIQSPINEEEVHTLVNAVVTAVYIGSSLAVPTDTSKYTGAVVYSLFDQVGGEIQTYDTFLMSCYLWKVYTSRHIKNEDGDETVLYISADGDSFVRTGADHKEIWYENFEVFPQGVFLAVHLPEKFADESIYTIAAAALLYLKVYKKAMECQRKYLAED